MGTVLKSLRAEGILRRGVEVFKGLDLLQNVWNRRKKVKSEEQSRVIEESFC